MRRGGPINEPHLPEHKKADLDVIRKVTHCAEHVQPIAYLRSIWPTSEVYSQHAGNYTECLLVEVKRTEVTLKPK